MLVYPAFILGVPQSADSIREWVQWSAIVAGGVVASGAALYKIGKWFKSVRAASKKAAAQLVGDLMKPKLDEINWKVDALKVSTDAYKDSNDEQHAEVAAQLLELRNELTAHRTELSEHMADSVVATEQLQATAAKVEEIATTVNLHVAALRNEITNPGLPVTPGPLNQGPPPGRKALF